jgi:hypothetical protein
VFRTSDVQAGRFLAQHHRCLPLFITSEIMARQRSDYAFLDVESYKIAQLFHELSQKCGERLVAAQQVARRHGVSAQRVLDLASKVEPEPLWRL